MEQVALQGVELRWLELHLRESHESAAGSTTHRPVVVVRIVSDASEGWGECAALAAPDYSEEYAEGAWTVLSKHLVGLLLDAARSSGGTLPDPKDLDSVLDAVRGNAMAKAALEMGVIDTRLRVAGVSLADFLGVTRESVPTGAVIGLAADRDRGAVSRLTESARQLVVDGYQRLKLKIAPWVDLSVVESLREAVPQTSLLADANASFDMADPSHMKILGALDELGLSSIEQPLAPDDLLGHRELSRRLKTRICLDESAASLGRIAEAIELGACGMFCLKPGRLGGIMRAAEAQRLCAEAGIPAYCGGMLETTLARSANAALSGLAGFSDPGDLSRGERFAEPDPFLVCQDGAAAPAGPVVPIERAPGVGPAPDPKALQAVTTRTQWFAV